MALTPCPIPQTAPTRAARYHGSPQHRGINAARWSGPAIACNEPAKTPPVMVAVNAEMAVMDWMAILFIGVVKHIVFVAARDRIVAGLGSADSDVVVLDV